jgi:hypothetical protein
MIGQYLLGGRFIPLIGRNDNKKGLLRFWTNNKNTIKDKALQVFSMSPPFETKNRGQDSREKRRSH